MATNLGPCCCSEVVARCVDDCLVPVDLGFTLSGITAGAFDPNDCDTRVNRDWVMSLIDDECRWFGCYDTALCVKTLTGNNYLVKAFLFHNGTSWSLTITEGRDQPTACPSTPGLFDFTATGAADYTLTAAYDCPVFPMTLSLSGTPGFGSGWPSTITVSAA